MIRPVGGAVGVRAGSYSIRVPDRRRGWQLTRGKLSVLALSRMTGNAATGENSRLAPEGFGTDYGKDVRNAFASGDQQASRCVALLITLSIRGYHSVHYNRLAEILFLCTIDRVLFTSFFV